MFKCLLLICPGKITQGHFCQRRFRKRKKLPKDPTPVKKKKKKGFTHKGCFIKSELKTDLNGHQTQMSQRT